MGPRKTSSSTGRDGGRQDVGVRAALRLKEILRGAPGSLKTPSTPVVDPPVFPDLGEEKKRGVRRHLTDEDDVE